MTRFLRATMLVAGVLAGIGEAAAQQVLPGPIPAEVVDVIDGDTLAVEAWVWLGQRVTTRVRVAGIDTPELRARCPDERLLAEAARERLSALVSLGPVTLQEVQYGTYAGRVVASVRVGTVDVGRDLLAAGLAVGYGGSGPRHDWCAAAP